MEVRCAGCKRQVDSSQDICPNCGASLKSAKGQQSTPVEHRVGALIAGLVGAAFLTIIVVANLGGDSRSDAVAPSGWRVVGGLSEGLRATFIEVEPAVAQDRRVYDYVVQQVCANPGPCIAAFFLPGDRVPARQSSAEFFRAGGWKDYKPVVLWFTGDYTKWDCERAGAAGAPQGALCGASSPGVSMNQSYSAILALAGRTSMAKACGWPPSDDAQAAQAYINSVGDSANRRELQEGFDKFMALKGGPDDPADCVRKRERVEARAKEARKVIGR